MIPHLGMRASLAIVALLTVLISGACSGSEQADKDKLTKQPSATRQPDSGSPNKMWPDEVHVVEYSPQVLQGCGIHAVSREVMWLLECAGRIVQVPAAAGIAPDPIELPAEAAGTDVLHGVDRSVTVLLLQPTNGEPRGRMVEVEPENARKLASHAFGTSIPYDSGGIGSDVWVVTIDGKLLRVTQDGKVETAWVSAVPLIHVAVDADNTWTVDEQGGVSVRSSGKSGDVKTISIGESATQAQVVRGALWLGTSKGLQVVNISRELSVEQLPLRGRVNDVEQCGGSVWVAQPGPGARERKPSLSRVSLSGRVRETLVLPAAPLASSCASGRLWIMTEDGQVAYVDVDVA